VTYHIIRGGGGDAVRGDRLTFYLNSPIGDSVGLRRLVLPGSISVYREKAQKFFPRE
jgi:hypothetical protein